MSGCYSMPPHAISGGRKSRMLLGREWEWLGVGEQSGWKTHQPLLIALALSTLVSNFCMYITLSLNTSLISVVFLSHYHFW